MPHRLFYDRAVSEPEPARIRVPRELERGAYADFLHAWHTPNEFTLDFCTSLPTESVNGDADYLVVARIKVAVTAVFDMLRILNDRMTRYEEQFGEIRRPGE